MKNIFLSLHPSRQLLLALISALIGSALIAFVIVLPLHKAYSAKVLERSAMLEQLEELNTLVLRFRELEPEQSAALVSTASLSALVNESLQGQPFQPAQIRQNDAGQLQLRLDGVSFDALLGWLQELETKPGVLLSDISINQVNEDRVSVNLTLQQY